MNISYDEVGDILYIEFPGEDVGLSTHEAGDGILVQTGSQGAIRLIEVWNFRRRASGDSAIRVPLEGLMRRELARAGR